MALSRPWIGVLFLVILGSLLGLGCGSNSLVGKWKVASETLSGIEEFYDDGTFNATLEYVTPIGTVRGSATGNYSSTQTTVTTSVTSFEVDSKSLPPSLLERASYRVKRMAFVTQVIQLKWVDHDTILASGPDGKQFKLERVK